MAKIGKDKYIFGTVKVGERGQIVIPKEARELFKINPGDTLLVAGDINKGLAITKVEGIKGDRRLFRRYRLSPPWFRTRRPKNSRNKREGRRSCDCGNECGKQTASPQGHCQDSEPGASARRGRQDCPHCAQRHH